MAQLSDEKRKVEDNADRDDREALGWGSPMSSENSSPKMACVARDNASEDAQDGGANTQSSPIYKNQSKSSTRLDFLDDDDDDLFIEKALPAPLPQTNVPAVREEKEVDWQEKPVQAAPTQSDINCLFDSSESEDDLFRKPQHSRPSENTFRAEPEDSGWAVNLPSGRGSDVEDGINSGVDEYLDGYREDQIATPSEGPFSQQDAGIPPGNEIGGTREFEGDKASDPAAAVLHADSEPSFSGPKHLKADLVKTLSVMKENILRPRPLVKSLSTRILVSKRVASKRCVNGNLVLKEQTIFHFSQIEVPKLKDIEISDKKINEIIGMNLGKNTPIDRIESCLGIKSKPVLENDILIDKSVLNQLLMCDGTADLKAVGELVIKHGAGDALQMELLKAKMGLGSNLAQIKHFDPGYLAYVIRLNNPNITRSFINLQNNFILYYIVFYKLGLVTVNDFATRFYNNLHYLSVLSRVNKSENLSIFEPARLSSENKGWSLKSVLDFGISKILNVENREANARDGSNEESCKKLVGPGADLPSKSGPDSNSDRDQPPVQNIFSPRQPVLGNNTPRFMGGMTAKPSGQDFGAGTVTIQDTGRVLGDGFRDTRAESKPGDDIVDNRNASTDNFRDRLSISKEANVDIKNLFDDDEDVDIFGDKSDLDDATDIITQINRLSIKNQSDEEQIADVPPDNALASVVDELEAGEKEDPADTDDSELRSNAPTDQKRLPVYQNDKNACSSSSLEKNETQGIYKKKFSKSFADIFSLGSQGDDSASLDVSTYVDDINENDKPMLVKDFEEESKSSIFNVFGIFKKKDKAVARKNAEPPKPRPLRSTMKIPEKARVIVKSVYANKKSHSLEIPGAGAHSAKKQAIHPDRSCGAVSQNLDEDAAEKDEK